jgi:hypothetical protein
LRKKWNRHCTRSHFGGDHMEGIVEEEAIEVDAEVELDPANPYSIDLNLL